ncbi:glycosyltransferase [Microbulbifer aggregans]|uniref:glycosyltransferase n=1 Tax=Microbulbifer aggregans TaxID=1769779 RepID=UPI001CFD623B|nr:glycosyltransferase [Microbulbifer aggregans]
MANNQTAFQRFAELLDTKQKEFDVDRDIREYVLSASKKAVAFGYARENIENKFGSNLPSLFPNIASVDDPGINYSELYFASGTIYRDAEHSHGGAVKLFNEMPETSEVILFEAGFLATTHSWSHSFREGKPEYACLGYVYDDISHYFMADYPNRIIQKLNSDEKPSTEELVRVEKLIKRLVERRISKYNAQPMHAPAMTEGYVRRVLVCDQAYADASTIYGKVDESAFEKMLVAALQENPDAEILVKTHPDSSWEKSKRSGYYSHLTSSGRVRLLREPVNPYCIFDLVDKVYVGTSQMGLEALFAGKEVVCFGAPFYAGWGLTDDRQHIPHRHRQRSLDELFHYFYIWYTIYHVPGYTVPSKIEDALDYIEANRPYTLPPSEAELTAPPKVSIIVPVHGVEDYIEECLTSIQNQSLREIEIIPVNDCSPDRSQEIIDRLASKDVRIRPIVLGENVGQGFARNRGIENARGEYIWFIDADDWMPNRYFLEKAVSLADQESSDMVRGRRLFKQFESNKREPKIVSDIGEEYFSYTIKKTTFKEFPEILLSWNFWLWLYRRDFVEKHRIKFDLTQMEERSFIIKALLCSNQISLINEDAIRYRVRQDSTMRKCKSKRNVQQMLMNFTICTELFVKREAHKRDSPFNRHFRIVIWQFIKALFMGWTYRSIRKLNDDAVRAEFFHTVKTQLLKSDFSIHEEISPEAFYATKDTRVPVALKLAVAAAVAGRYDLVDTAVNLKKLTQTSYLDFQLDEPRDSSQADLQVALNDYARNNVDTVEGVYNLTGEKPRVVVHIGATKTGSTYIQHFFEKNRPALLRAGVWFPEVGLFWQPTRPHKQAGHAGFADAAVKSLPGLRDYIEAGLALMEGRVHTIVLSSEAFFLNQRAHCIAEYFSGYSVEMVAYLRRQDEWANAQYCEFVAGGAVGRVDIPFGEWLERPITQRRLDYRVPLSEWSDIIGVENVKVRIFEKAQLHDSGLLADFAETCRLPILLDLPEPEADDRNSARLSAAHVELVRVFNSRPFRDNEAYFNFIEEVTRGLQEWRAEQGLPMPKPWVISNEVASKIMRDAEAVNREVAKTYLGRERETLFAPTVSTQEGTTIYPEEIALVSAAYERAKPSDTLSSREERKVLQKVAAKTQDARSVSETYRLPKPAKIVNYGVFGWRYWGLTPVLAMLYARRATPERLRDFLIEPAEFARENWAQQHPFIIGLLYPNADPLGLFRLSRIWVPVMKALARLSGRGELSGAIVDDPIRFARVMRNPLRRAIGRLMFPCGELRSQI